MKCRIDQTCCGNAFLMHIHRNSSSVVRYSCRTVFFQRDMDFRTESCQMLVHCIVHDLINQVVQSFCGHASDIHSGTHTYRFQTFQHCNTACIVCSLS